MDEEEARMVDDVLLCERFSWTLTECREMDIEDRAAVLAIIEALGHYRTLQASRR